MALTWGLTAAILATASFFVARLLGLDGIPHEQMPSAVIVASRWALIGMAGGFVFAIAVIVAARRHTLHSLPPRLFIGAALAAGAVALYAGVAYFGGAALRHLPLSAWISLTPIAAVCATIGGAIATGMLVAARRAPLDSGSDATRLPPVV